MSKDDILKELNNHICGLSYINVISYLALNEIICLGGSDSPDPFEVLSYDEWLLVIGLWLKNINNEPLHEINSFEDVDSEARIIFDLLDKLHHSYIYEFSSIDFSNTESLPEVLKNTMESPSLVQEAIFYGGEGAYDLQYTSFIEEKYKMDRDWIFENKGIDINKLHPFYITIRQLLAKKMLEYREDMVRTHYDTQYDITYPYIIDIADVVNADSEYQRILDLFSFDLERPSEIRINGIEDFNPLVETPLIKIDKGRLFIPKCNIVACSLYELPFFWIGKDSEYYIKYGSANRGDAAETITKKLLDRIFPSENVLKNVIIIQRKNICAEIDILVKIDDVALIFQVKSKRLSIDSRKGNKETISKDFEQAIGKAYEQALASESKMKEPNSIIVCGGREVFVWDVKKTVKIGITLDYFPAVEAILRRGLGQDVPFISMSVFDLDMLTRYLSAEQFVDYVTFRVQHRRELFNSSEAGYLGFFLKHDGFEIIDKGLKKESQEGYNFVAIGEDYAFELDKRMNPDLMKEYLPELYAETIRIKNGTE